MGFGFDRSQIRRDPLGVYLSHFHSVQRPAADEFLEKYWVEFHIPYKKVALIKAPL